MQPAHSARKKQHEPRFTPDSYCVYCRPMVAGVDFPCTQPRHNSMDLPRLRQATAGHGRQSMGNPETKKARSSVMLAGLGG